MRRRCCATRRRACWPASPARARAPSSTGLLDDDTCNRLLSTGRPDRRSCRPRAAASTAATCRPPAAGAGHRRRGRPQVDARQRRPEQQRRVRQRSLRAEAVPPHRAGTNPDFEIAPFLTEQRLHAHAGAGRARIEYRRPGLEPGTLAVVQTRSSTRDRAGTSPSTNCAATTSGWPRERPTRSPATRRDG